MISAERLLALEKEDLPEFSKTLQKEEISQLMADRKR